VLNAEPSFHPSSKNREPEMLALSKKRCSENVTAGVSPDKLTTSFVGESKWVMTTHITLIRCKLGNDMAVKVKLFCSVVVTKLFCP
jgi:hypothetical protein